MGILLANLFPHVSKVNKWLHILLHMQTHIQESSTPLSIKHIVELYVGTVPIIVSMCKNITLGLNPTNSISWRQCSIVSARLV